MGTWCSKFSSRFPAGELGMVCGLGLAVMLSSPDASIVREPASSARVAALSAPPRADIRRAPHVVMAAASPLLAEMTCDPAVSLPWHTARCDRRRRADQGDGARLRGEVEPLVVHPWVTRWTSQIEASRAAYNLSVKDYPTEAILALIAIETLGNPWKRKFKGSHYYGLLQMGPMAMTDLGLGRGRDAAKILQGNGTLAIDLFFRYQRLYRSRVHDELGYHQERMALLWKMGPGSSLFIARELRRGALLEDAVARANRRFRVGRANDYLARFYEALELYRAWLASRDAPS